MCGKWQNALPVIAKEDQVKAILSVYIAPKDIFSRPSLLKKQSALAFKVGVSHWWRSI